MWLLLILLSTATSLVQVDGRPQGPDLAKLPPGEAAVTLSPEPVTTGADGASPSETTTQSDPLPAATDSAPTDIETTESYESVEPAQTPPAEEDPSLVASPSGGEPGDAPESPYAGEDSAAFQDPSARVASSEDLPEGGQPEEGEGEVKAAAGEGSTAASVVTPPPPSEPAAVETDLPFPKGAETEEQEPAVVETGASESTETEAPEPVVVKTEAPESEAVETKAPKPALPAGPAPAAVEPAASTKPAPAVEEPVAEAVPADEKPATEAAATAPDEEPATQTPPAAKPVTEAAVTGPEGTTPAPEPEQGSAEQGKAAVEAPDAAAEMLPGGAASSVAELGEERTGKLKVAGPLEEPPSPADEDAAADDTGAAGPSPPGTDDGAAARTDGAPATDGAAPPADPVELEDVFNQGVELQLGKSPLLWTAMDNKLKEVLLKQREVDYRVGRQRVTSVVTDLQVTGINNVRVLNVSSNMDEMTLNATFEFPKITITGFFNATGSILRGRQSGMLLLRTPFPSYGHGNITAVIADTTAVSQAELSHSFNDRKLSVELLTCQLTFGKPDVRLTDVKLPRALRKLHFERLFKMELGKMISHQLKTEIEPKVDESLHDVITGVLDQVSLDSKSVKKFASLGAGPGAWKLL